MKAGKVGCKGLYPRHDQDEVLGPNPHRVLKKAELDIDGHCIAHLCVWKPQWLHLDIRIQQWPTLYEPQ